ncbi:hypothetical protein MCC02031_14590 [Bifidobacteriaceae bacterium MCC02031]|nr:hypothetical protein MCC02031_14590 [Bifidobacteriaceae bacterium MCC02031]
MRARRSWMFAATIRGIAFAPVDEHADTSVDRRCHGGKGEGRRAIHRLAVVGVARGGFQQADAGGHKSAHLIQGGMRIIAVMHKIPGELGDEAIHARDEAVVVGEMVEQVHARPAGRSLCRRGCVLQISPDRFRWRAWITRAGIPGPWRPLGSGG